MVAVSHRPPLRSWPVATSFKHAIESQEPAAKPRCTDYWGCSWFYLYLLIDK